MGLKSCIAMIELFKLCPKKVLLSDDVSYHRTASCNPTSRKLESCNQCWVLGLQMYFENSHNLFPSTFYKESYDRKHKTWYFHNANIQRTDVLAYQH